MKILEYISYLMIPLMILGILFHAMKKKVSIYENFTEGVVEGAKTAFKIFPTILAIIVAINIFRASGALQILIQCISPITHILGIPEEVVPLGIMSSISGGASLGLLGDTLQTYGPDSVIGKTASTILGSSETTLYVLAIYTATIGIKKTRGALYIALLCDLVAVCVAVWLCR